MFGCNREECLDVIHILAFSQYRFYQGADKSLAWPGRKQATATKL